jgi:hypothetical protein
MIEKGSSLEANDRRLGIALHVQQLFNLLLGHCRLLIPHPFPYSHFSSLAFHNQAPRRPGVPVCCLQQNYWIAAAPRVTIRDGIPSYS